MLQAVVLVYEGRFFKTGPRGSVQKLENGTPQVWAFCEFSTIFVYDFFIFYMMEKPATGIFNDCRDNEEWNRVTGDRYAEEHDEIKHAQCDPPDDDGNLSSNEDDGSNSSEESLFIVSEYGEASRDAFKCKCGCFERLQKRAPTVLANFSTTRDLLSREEVSALVVSRLSEAYRGDCFKACDGIRELRYGIVIFPHISGSVIIFLGIMSVRKHGDIY